MSALGTQTRLNMQQDVLVLITSPISIRCISMDLLVLVLDLNPVEWGKRGTQQAEHEQQHKNDTTTVASASAALPPFSTIFSQILIFLNAFMLLSKQNKLSVIAAHPRTAEYLYPNSFTDNTTQISSSRTTSERKRKEDAENNDDDEVMLVNDQQQTARSSSSSSVSVIVKKEVQRLIKRHQSAVVKNSEVEENGSMFAPAVSLGLCYINRLKRVFPKLRSRLLVISASEDNTYEYVTMMNAIFSAHKLQVPVDSCVLHSEDSLFLQQASAITSGLYLHPSAAHQSAVLQHLLFTFLPDPISRSHLILPQQSSVDYRATCFCHRRVVDQAMVCPVCLAIYCKATPRCAMCQSQFQTQIVRTNLSTTTTVKQQQTETKVKTEAQT